MGEGLVHGRIGERQGRKKGHVGYMDGWKDELYMERKRDGWRDELVEGRNDG